jgi:RNA polymerase sporulation-specific sigma factor
MLSHEETLDLIKKAQNGDENAKSILLQNNYPLIKSIIKRYLNKGVDYDDLYQLGCVGFLKAINNFNVDFNVHFSTYVVPMVAGEVKRFLRDDGSIKVSRALKTLNYKINRYLSEYKNENNEPPTIEQIAKNFNVETSDVFLAMDSNKGLVSLDEKIDEDDDKSSCIKDEIPFENQREIIDYLTLKNALVELSLRDKKIIILRYFRNKTQSEVAELLNVSQVQVSRLENKIIEKIRKKFDIGTGTD